MKTGNCLKQRRIHALEISEERTSGCGGKGCVGATEGAKRRYTEVAAEAYARPFRVEVCSRAKRWRNRRYSQMAFCGDVRPGGAAALGDQYFSRREPLQLRKQRVGQAVALPMSAAKG